MAVADRPITDLLDETAELISWSGRKRYQMIRAGTLFTGSDVEGETYQRELDMNRVEAFANDFDEDLLQIITVAQRPGGGLVVIDGQHRAAAARLLDPDYLIPCEVYTGLSFEEEAQLYVSLNANRRKMTPPQIFKGRLMAGDPDAIATNQIVDDAGYRMQLYQGAGGGGGIQAIAAITKAYTMDRGATLRKSLAATSEAWGFEDAPRSRTINAVTAFVRQYKTQYQHQRLVDVLSAVSQRRLENGIKIHIAELSDASVDFEGATSGGRYIRHLYNKGLRTRKMPGWVAGRQLSRKASSTDAPATG